MRVTEHTKAIIAAIAAVAYVLNEGVFDGVMDADDTGKLIAAVIAVAGVWVFPNSVKAPSR